MLHCKHASRKNVLELGNKQKNIRWDIRFAIVYLFFFSRQNLQIFSKNITAQAFWKANFIGYFIELSNEDLNFMELFNVLVILSKTIVMVGTHLVPFIVCTAPPLMNLLAERRIQASFYNKNLAKSTKHTFALTEPKPDRMSLLSGDPQRSLLGLATCWTMQYCTKSPCIYTYLPPTCQDCKHVNNMWTTTCEQ